MSALGVSATPSPPSIITQITDEIDEEEEEEVEEEETVEEEEETTDPPVDPCSVNYPATGSVVVSGADQPIFNGGIFRERDARGECVIKEQNVCAMPIGDIMGSGIEDANGYSGGYSSGWEAHPNPLACGSNPNASWRRAYVKFTDDCGNSETLYSSCLRDPGYPPCEIWEHKCD